MIIGLCQLPLLWRYRYWSRSHDILLSSWELGIWKKIRKFPRFQRFQLLKEEVPLRKWLREFEYQASFIIPLKKSFREKWWHRPDIEWNWWGLPRSLSSIHEELVTLRPHEWREMLVSLFPGSPVKVERFSLLSPFLIGQDRPFLKTCKWGGMGFMQRG
jgi:hypothetical protein